TRIPLGSSGTDPRATIPPEASGSWWAPVFKLCFRSSRPFARVLDLGASGAAAPCRPTRSARVAIAAAVGWRPPRPVSLGKTTLLNATERHLDRAPGVVTMGRSPDLGLPTR